MEFRIVMTTLSIGVMGFCSAQLVVNNTLTADQLVQNVLLGGGVTATNVTFNGLPGNMVSVQAAQFDASASNVGAPLGMTGILNGVLLASGEATLAVGPNADGSTTLPVGGLQTAGDPDLDVLVGAGNVSADAAVLEFDFIPTGDSLRFRYVFGSEEYLEWVNSSFNDAFGFFLSGPGIAGPFLNGAENIALVPMTATPVSINTVNNLANAAYYQDNGDGFTAPWNTDPTALQFDGMTVVMEAFALVQCGQTYHIKLAVGDGGDAFSPDYSYDSGVFLEAGSFTSTGQVLADLSGTVGLLNDSTILEGCGTIDLSFTRLGDTSVADTLDLIVGGTATPGIDYSPALPSQLIYQPGDSVITITLTIPLDPDGTETILIQIDQLLQCAGVNVQSNYTFYIQGPPPLTTTTGPIMSDCGLTELIGVGVIGGYGLYNYVWSTSQITDSISVSPNTTTTYYVTVSDTCGLPSVMDSVVVTIPVYPPLNITVTPDTAAPCLQNVNLQVTSTTGGNGIYTYDWTDGVSSLGATSTLTVTAGAAQYYYVTVGEGCGNFVTDSILVSQQVLPPVQVYASDVTAICPGDNVLLSIDSVVGGNGVYSYTWSQGGVVLASTTTFSVSVISTQGYVITAQDQCGTIGSAGVAAILPYYDPLDIDLTDNQIICLGDSLDLQALITGGSGIYTIEWNTIEWYDTLFWSDPIVNVRPDQNTWFPVTVTDQCGSQTADSVIIYVEDVNTDIVVTQPGQDDVALFASSTPPGVFFLWDLGDGTTLRGPEIRHSYLDLEDHFVQLIVRTENGCWDTSKVFIPAPAHIYFPNAFTPDDDTFNDFFGPAGHNISEFEMFIFDRWGQQIYYTDDGTPWDGKVNGGDIAKQDVYVYHFRTVGHMLPAYERTGHVTLIK